MSVVSYEIDSSLAVPPEKLFKIFVLEPDTLLPKVVPQVIEKSETIEGDGGPGSIKKITFAEGHKLKFVKQKIEAVDKEGFSYSYSVIEGGGLTSDKVEKISYDVKFVPSPDGGSIIKRNVKVHKKDDFDLTEEQIKAGMEKFSGLGLFKVVEAYFAANPDA